LNEKEISIKDQNRLVHSKESEIDNFNKRIEFLTTENTRLNNNVNKLNLKLDEKDIEIKRISDES